MKNTFGTNLCVTIFGESHGTAIGAVIDGLPAGIEINNEYILNKLAERRPSGRISTQRVEKDEFQIVSGAYEGYTTGSPLTVIIPNEQKISSDYKALEDTPRPSHADFTARVKYRGFEDKRGGGHFSGRITAALVAAGAIVSYALEKKGIYVGSHISYLGGIKDKSFEKMKNDELTECIKKLDCPDFPVISATAAKQMKEKIEQVAKEGDSIGGIIEGAVVGLCAGIGEPWFDGVEGVLSRVLFAIPGIKGVEFGAGFGFADMTGSCANDQFVFDGDTVTTLTNNNGGINGGITNGMPVIFRCAIKPTPSIYKEQNTVNLKTRDNVSLTINGRHDPAIIHRARAVVDAACAIAIADLIISSEGTKALLS